MFDGFWWFVFGIPILILGGISILFYLTIVLIPYYLLLITFKTKPAIKLYEWFKEVDDDMPIYILFLSIPFDIYFAFYLYDYDFNWKTLFDTIFNLIDAFF